MNSLATVQTTKQVKELITKLEALGYKFRTNMKDTVVMETAEGVRCFSAISPYAGKWSVMVSKEVAHKMSLPLWKDTPMPGIGNYPIPK